SPSFTPGSSYGRSGCGSDSVIAMSRYVQRASNAARKISGLKRGSVAFRITSAPVSRASVTTDETSDASNCAAADRYGVGREATAAWEFVRSSSARVTWSNAGRRSAMAAMAVPTPPAPTMSTFTAFEDPSFARAMQGETARIAVVGWSQIDRLREEWYESPRVAQLFGP